MNGSDGEQVVLARAGYLQPRAEHWNTLASVALSLIPDSGIFLQ